MTKICPVCKKKFEGKGAKKYCSLVCSSSIVYYSRKGVRNETLCWRCKNACGNCSWSAFFHPVKGWNAKKTKIKVSSEQLHETESYIVKSCPQFIKDERR